MKMVRVEHSAAKYKDWVRIEWNLGRRCNFDCSYCSPDLHDNISSHISVESVNNTVSTIKDFYKDKGVRMSLTGGEPFVHPKILTILSAIKDAGFNEVSSITNGSLPLAKYLAAAEFLSTLIISWHFDHANHDHMKHILLGLANSGNPLNFFVHLMFLPGRLDLIKETVAWMTANNIRFVVRRIRPLFTEDGNFLAPGSSGKLGLHKQHMPVDGYYSTDELEFITSLEKIGTNGDNVLITYVDATTALTNTNTMLRDRTNTFTNWQCMAGIETLHIGNDGVVHRATCKQGEILGTIDDGFTLSPDPILCKKKWCNCAGDINITKWVP